MVNKNWTPEEVLAAYQAYLKENSMADSKTPLHQWLALKHLDSLEAQFKTDKSCLMEAIDVCAREGLPMPEWVAVAYREAYRRVIHTQEEKSWDVVFGDPYKKNTQLKAERKLRDLMVQVLNTAKEIRKSDTRPPSGKEFTREIGRRLWIGNRQAEEIYYKAIKDHRKTIHYFNPLIEHFSPRKFKK